MCGWKVRIITVRRSSAFETRLMLPGNKSEKHIPSTGNPLSGELTVRLRSLRSRVAIFMLTEEVEIILRRRVSFVVAALKAAF